MHNDHHLRPVSFHMSDMFLFLLTLLLLLAYYAAARTTSHRLRRWPLYRHVCWTLGILSLVLSLVGPIAEQAHHQFTAHMMVHLLLGMIGPLFIAFSCPMTLALRTLSTSSGRKLTRLLKSRLVQMFSHPLVAALLNIGGLWILYTTELYAVMHESLFLYAAIHIHVFLAGYLFTISILGNEPAPHRYPIQFRIMVLILAAAGHNILSKHLYAHPPSGVSVTQAETGSMLMYYGGDLVDIVIMVALCHQWYKTARSHRGTSTVKPAA